LQPGQVSAQLGAWAGSIDGKFESMAMVRVAAPISGRLEPMVVLGIHRHSDGDIDLRDGVIGLGWTPLSTDTLTLRLQPGLNLPIGSVEEGFAFTPLSTASIDPFLQVDFVYGGTWLVGTTASARVPLYLGSDRSLQGPFTRMDVWGARRLGDVVPWVGLSLVGLGPSDPVGEPPAFTELSATLGTVVNVSPRWSLTGQLRVPVPEAASAGALRGPAGGLTVAAVTGRRREEEHEEGDGHDHGEHPEGDRTEEHDH
jgi:hypothetical protein